MEKTFDLGILTVFDPTPIEVENIQQQAHSNIVQLYQKLSQIRFQNIKANDEKPDELQKHDFDRGIYEIDLPEPEFIFPRKMPLPKEKPLSKWQKFAKEKGIKSKKRGYKEWDEELKDYVPRFGPHSGKRQKDKMNWAVEVKPGDDPYEDPFRKAKLQKKLVKEQQKMSEIKNKLNSKGMYGRGILNEQAAQRKQKTQNIKNTNKRSLSVAQQSTRSMGNFDKKAHQDEKQVKAKKRKVIPNFKSSKEENQRNLDVFKLAMQSKNAPKK